MGISKLDPPGKYSFGYEWAAELEEGIIGNLSKISAMEIIPENFFEGRYNNFLKTLKKKGTPVAVHGVLLSIGSMEPLNEAHLDKVLEVAAQVEMVNLSEHLSLTRVGDVDLDALTPLAWTEEVADAICKKIERIQARIDVPFLIENVSNRFIFPGAEMSETEFINRIVDRTGCGLLLDVTNVYTNSVNFNFDPYAWLDDVNLEAVQLIHLAGGDFDPDGFLMDSHDNTVANESWDLYRQVCEAAPPFMTIIERTGNFPNFATLEKELTRAKNTVKKVARGEGSRRSLKPEEAIHERT